MRGIFLFSIFISSFSVAQTQDAEVWAGIGLKADVTKKLSLKYETQTRFYKNASTLKTYYNELSLDYEMLKNLELGASYRYARRNREGYFIGGNRISINTSYGIKFGETGLRLKTRARYQYSFDRLSVINNFIYPDIDHLFRCKFDLKYKNDDFKRVAPFVGYELFKAIQPSEAAGLDAYRLYLGIDFDLPARHEIGIKYIYELENNSQPSVTHAYIVQYNYELSSKLFKKKKD